MRFFNIDLHASVIADVAHIFKELGHTVDDISLSGHYWVMGKPKGVVPLNDGTNLTCGGVCSQELCDLFYESYKDKLDKYDGFICCYPVEFALLYEKFNKPIIVVNCVRYEHPNTQNPALWKRLNDFLLRKHSESQLYFVCNNKGDVQYAKYFLGIEGIHIPSLCEYTNAHYTGTKGKYLVHNRSHVVGVPHDLVMSLDQVKDPATWRYTWDQIYAYKGIVHVPYHNGSMSIFEHYTANVPMFFPSKKFAKELFAQGKMFDDLTFYKIYNMKEPEDDNNPNKLSNPKNLNMWIDTCDFYDDDNMKYTQKFDSFGHLTQLLYTVDLKQISADMKTHNILRKKQVYDSWSSILNSIKNKKISPTITITMALKKCIVFALYGDNPKYTLGLVINCVYAKKLFPDWVVRIYYDSTVPSDIVTWLNAFDNTELILMENNQHAQGMFWRLLAAFDKTVDVVISRDADSWLSIRDKIMVDEWLNSSKDFHIIRDHCHHRSPIMGGTWGARNGVFSKVTSLQEMSDYLKENPTHVDQWFMNRFMYKNILPYTFIHGIMTTPMEGEKFAVATPPTQWDDIDGLPFSEVAQLNPSYCDGMCAVGVHIGFVGCQITRMVPKCDEHLEQLKTEMLACVDEFVNDDAPQTMFFEETKTLMPEKKNAICYSLYNKGSKYMINALINCMLAPFVYPGWICRFYVDDTIPLEIDTLLKTFEHVQVINMPRHTDSEAMLWRFTAISDPSINMMISRDADSWLSSRESWAVYEWTQSQKDFHIIRDHCYHSQAVMGGMWGARNGVIQDMDKRVETFMKSGETYDQGFLAKNIYPIVKAKNTMFVHFGDPQYNNNGIKLPNGHFNDGGVPLPKYDDCDEHIPGISFAEANQLNSFKCAHCGQTHKTLIGGIIEHIPPRAVEIVKSYAGKHGVFLDSIIGS